MLKKTCPNCQNPSYSADNIYTWICPYYGKDITEVKAKPVTDNANLQISEIERRNER